MHILVFVCMTWFISFFLSAVVFTWFSVYALLLLDVCWTACVLVCKLFIIKGSFYIYILLCLFVCICRVFYALFLHFIMSLNIYQLFPFRSIYVGIFVCVCDCDFDFDFKCTLNLNL